MTYCDGDIIQVTEDYRLKVMLDNISEDPLEWGWGTEIHEIDNYRMWRGWDGVEDGLLFAARAAVRRTRDRGWSEEQRDRAIRLYMHWLGDTRSFEVQEWRGYSKSDWATVLVLWDEKDGSNVYESWAAWRRGDVFVVAEEIRKVYVNPDDPEDIFEDWFEEDSLWGCYLDEDYTPEEVAHEHFDHYPTCGECTGPAIVGVGFNHQLNCSKREI